MREAEAEAARGRYHLETAEIVDVARTLEAGRIVCAKSAVALVGLHIAIKTSSRPQWCGAPSSKSTTCRRPSRAKRVGPTRRTMAGLTPISTRRGRRSSGRRSARRPPSRSTGRTRHGSIRHRGACADGQTEGVAGMMDNDAQLVALLDGELDEETGSRLLARIASDKNLQNRYDALREAGSSLASAFDSPLEEAPLSRLRTALHRERPGREAWPPLARVLFRAMAFAVAPCILAAGVGAWLALILTTSSKEDWRSAVADYTNLYTNEGKTGQRRRDVGRGTRPGNAVSLPCRSSSRWRDERGL